MENLKLCAGGVGSGAGELRGAGAAVPRAAWVEKVNNVHTDQENVRKRVYREYAGCGQGIETKRERAGGRE